MGGKEFVDARTVTPLIPAIESFSNHPFPSELPHRSHESRGWSGKVLTRGTNPTQADVLIAMLREARAKHRPLELPAIMQAGIAQHGARFNEIRARGFVVVNETERSSGAVRSRYRLMFDPESEGQ